MSIATSAAANPLESIGQSAQSYWDGDDNTQLGQNEVVSYQEAGSSDLSLR